MHRSLYVGKSLQTSSLTMNSQRPQIKVPQKGMAHKSNTATSRRRAEERNALVALLDDIRVHFCKKLRLSTYTIHVLLECGVDGSASQIRSNIVVQSNVQAQLTIWRE